MISDWLMTLLLSKMIEQLEHSLKMIDPSEVVFKKKNSSNKEADGGLIY